MLPAGRAPRGRSPTRCMSPNGATSERAAGRFAFGALPSGAASPWRTRGKWSGRGLQRSFQRCATGIRCLRSTFRAISLSFDLSRTAARPPALEILAGSMPYIVTDRIWRRSRWPPEAQAGASRPHPRRLTPRSHPESPNWCRSRPARPGRACLHFAQCPPGRQQ